MITKYLLCCLLAFAAMQTGSLARAQSTGASAGALSPAVAKVADAAAAGDAESQYTLAQMYGSGSGVPRDPAAAALWLQKAANQGHANAQFSLGTSYLLGDGVPKSAALAIEWLNKSAQQGNSLAQANLGAIYLNGDGVAQNFRVALSWFEKAAAQGLPLAQYSLGKMHQNGYGVRTDETAALQWYARAAAQDYAPARQALADLKRPAAARPANAVTAAPPAAAAAVTAAPEQAAVLAAIRDWAAAWSRKDVDAYLGYYAEDFRSPNGESRSDWAAQRRARINSRKRIAIEIIAPRIAMNGDNSEATVTFTQNYLSDQLAETSAKTLVLVRRGDAWKIVQETARKAGAGHK
ncbi:MULTISPECIES: nuclear transport factor 2 family protein [unclassified Herbaspirillum]|uniref:L,D-transpeptidase Cds6 family protein n=1 Tax=unclassified Herbaspirillum TaxID=2624150 RepID=UPI001314CDBF|nr:MULTISPECIES: nuclear transport factor 2 family protein [unclassified Herbaspirillum]